MQMPDDQDFITSAFSVSAAPATTTHKITIAGVAWPVCITLMLLLQGCQAPAPPSKFLEQADRLHEQALGQTVLTDPELADYIQQVADRIANAAHDVAPEKVNAAFINRVRCQLVNCRTINCFSAGGVHVYVTNGLFQQCESEEQLAAAIAHAYAHLINLDLETTKLRPDGGGPLSMAVWQFVANRFTLAQSGGPMRWPCESTAAPDGIPFGFRHFSSIWNHSPAEMSRRIGMRRRHAPSSCGIRPKACRN